MTKTKNGVSEGRTGVRSETETNRIPVDPDSLPTIPAAMEYDYTNFYFGAGTDAFALLEPFDD